MFFVLLFLRFVIAFENDIVEGYITEKLLNGIFSNSIPVYFGANDISNQSFFISCCYCLKYVINLLYDLFVFDLIFF